MVASQLGAPRRRSQRCTGVRAMTTTSARNTGPPARRSARSPATAMVAAAAPTSSSSQRGIPPGRVPSPWTAYRHALVEVAPVASPDGVPGPPRPAPRRLSGSGRRSGRGPVGPVPGTPVVPPSPPLPHDRPSGPIITAPGPSATGSVQQSGHLGQLEEDGRRPGARTAGVRVRPGGQQPGDRVGRLAEDGGGEGRLAAVVGAGVVRPAVQQRAHRLGVTVVGGQDEQRVALVVGEVHRNAGVDVGRELLGAAAPGQVEHPAGQLDDPGVDRLSAHAGQPRRPGGSRPGR